MRRSPDYKRADRVSEFLRQELADILLREIKDPSIGSVTLTRIHVTDDLRSARIFFGVLDRTARAEEVARGLQRAEPRIHHLLGKRMRTKHIPRLTFTFDRNLDYGIQIAKILSDLEDDRDDNREDDQEDKGG